MCPHANFLLENASILTSIHRIFATAFVDLQMGCTCMGASYENIFLFGVYFGWCGATVFLVFEHCAC
jgi:hypothetical protein